jgi:hypothetical protein
MREKRLVAQKEAEWKKKMEKENEQPSFLARVTTLGEKSAKIQSRQGRGQAEGV